MPEASLKDLSERAVAGPWRHVVGDDYWIESDSYPKGPTHSPVVDDTGNWCLAIGNRPKDFGEATSQFIVALVNAYRRGDLHDATALAEAKAQARRDAFEGAAKLIGPHGPRPCDCEPWGCCCQNPGDTAAVAAWDQETALAAAIRALATAPAETEEPETGEAGR